MTIYAVHLPSGEPDPARAAERARFVRAGFCWPALLFGPFWMLAGALWRGLVVWCFGAVVVALAVSSGRLPGSGAVWLYVLSAVFLGLEGRTLVAAATERDGLGLVDVIQGGDRDEAEAAFYARLVANRPSAPIAPASPNLPIVPNHVIGSFPEPGGR
ncbi:MAG: DUF2628 domain-containing protein [Roseiarcus sp.]